MPPTLRRIAGRALVVDRDDRVLLLRGGDPARPDAGTWWFTPGGGTEPGESTADAARRELVEETGFVVDEVGPVVLSRHATFEFAGMLFDQDEDFFLIRADAFEIDTAGMSPLEVLSVVGHRWWPLGDLRSTDEVVYPDGLADLLDRLLNGD